MQESNDYQPQFSLWVRQLITIILLIAAVYVLTLIAPVLPMLTVAFLIAFVMFIPSRALARRTPLSYTLSVVILYILLLVVIGLAMLILTPTLIAGINNLLRILQQGYTDLSTSVQTLKPQDAVIEVLGVTVNVSDMVRTAQSLLLNGGTTARASAFLMPAYVQSTAPVQSVTLSGVLDQVLPLFGSVSQTLTSAIGSITGFVGSFLLAIFISFLVLADIPMTQQAIARDLPAAYHREFALLVQRISRVWNGFFRGQVLIGFAIGVLTFIQLSAMGISNTFILAVITGVISLIPTIGGIIALVPLSLIPAIQGSQTFPQVPNLVVAALVVLFNLVITQVIWNVVAPKILGDALDLPLPVIIVGVFIGAAAGGVLGAFLVAPIMATARIVFAYLWHKINLEDPYPGEDAPFQWQDDSFVYHGRFRPLVRIASRLPPRQKTP